MSEKEIRQHYATREVKPTYFIIRNDSVELYCATTGADTLPPLLLIHGAPGAWYSGMGVLDDPDLQKKYHINLWKNGEMQWGWVLWIFKHQFSTDGDIEVWIKCK